MDHASSSTRRKYTMVLKLEDILKPYFQEQPHAGFVCLVDNCNKLITSMYSYNRKRHIINRHRDLSKRLRFIDLDENILQNEQEDHEGENEKFKEFVPATKNRKISVDIDADTYIKGCVKMVTLGNIPFSIFMQEGFKEIVAPIEKSLGIVTDTPSIMKQIEDISSNFKMIIRKELKNKLISLKFDCVTMKNVSIIGINAQFIHAAELKIRTLAMLEYKISEATTNLRCEIMKVLEDYEIDLNNVYTCTTDNGLNTLKTANLFKDEQKLLCEKYCQDNLFTIWDDGLVYARGDEFISFVESELLYLMTPVRCEVHTLKLAVRDFLQQSEVANEIISAKHMFLKQSEVPLDHPQCSDMTNNWNYTYDVLKYLSEQKDCITKMDEDDKEIKFNPKFWNFIKNFLEAFEPVYNCMKKLQEEQLTMGDFYKTWLECKVGLGKVNNHLAKLLLEAMDKLKHVLFENEAFIGALYLDPRFNYKGTVHLCEKTKFLAKTHLEKTWQRLQTSCPNNLELKVEANSHSQCTSELETFMRQMDEHAAITSTASTDMNEKLTGISFGARVNVDESVLQYWEMKKESDSELYSLAQTVLAAPATQISVERSFIAVAHSLVHPKTNDQSENTQNMLLINLNRELFRSISLFKDAENS